MKEIQVFHVAPSIPEPVQFLEELAENLWWCWHGDAIQMFRRIDADAWRESGHNAVEFLNRLPNHVLETLAKDSAFCDHLKTIETSYRAEMEGAIKPVPGTPQPCVSYFSLEFGMHESLRVYSGGLGILAGDHLKTASDCKLPLAAVGLFYHQGFFQQELDDSGWQQEHYPQDPTNDLPITRALTPEGVPVKVSVTLPEGEMHAIVWRANVGRVPLYLLDSNIPENPPELQGVTAQLYGGGKQNRLRQELLLGIGGFRMMLALGYEPEVCHLNEGHAAFLSLARMEHLMKDRGFDFDTAFEITSRTNVFTTHTPVPAGNEAFDLDLLKPHLKALESQVGVSAEQVITWGSGSSQQSSGELSMTVLGLRLSHRANGVSALHGEVARDMWKDLWPSHTKDEVPISSVTNGVHVPTWLSSENAALFDRYLGSDWEQNYSNPDILNRILTIPDEEIWKAHQMARARMIRFARVHMENQYSRRYANTSTLSDVRSVLDHEVLTIGFARRAAEYKRGNLLLSDPERLDKLLNDSKRPIQFVFSGKAHPADEIGKGIIKQIVEFSQRESSRHRVIFLENYDMRVARFMVQGVDVWLNTPRRNQEASGTSGMKAALNGVLHASILDGWWCEGYAENCGWAIGLGESLPNQEYQDQLEARALYNIIEDEVIPCFYDRVNGADPIRWVRMMKASMAMALGQFSSRRMVEEYNEDYYTPAALEYRGLMADNASRARDLVGSRHQLGANWPNVRCSQPCTDRDVSKLVVGDSFGVSARVFLGEIKPDEADVEVCYGPVGSKNRILESRFAKMAPTGDNQDGWQTYSCQITCQTSGRHGFTARIVPRGSNWKNTMPGYITWAEGSGSAGNDQGGAASAAGTQSCKTNPGS